MMNNLCSEDGDFQEINYGNLVRYLLPGQRPGEWQPDIHIDLLPALRCVYPECIKNSVLSIRLVCNTNQKFNKRVFKLSEIYGEKEFEIWPITQDGTDGYDYSDSPIEEFPHEIVLAVLDPGRVSVIQEMWGIFKPSSFNMMRRIKNAVQDEAKNFDWKTLEDESKRFSFLHSTILDLAEHIVGKIDFLEPIKSELQTEEAMLSDGTCKNRWLEFGKVGSNSENIWAESFIKDMEDEVYKLAEKMESVIKLALWLVDQKDEGFPGKEYFRDWIPDDDYINRISIKNIHSLFRKEATYLISKANEDYQEQSEFE